MLCHFWVYSKPMSLNYNYKLHNHLNAWFYHASFPGRKRQATSNSLEERAINHKSFRLQNWNLKTVKVTWPGLPDLPTKMHTQLVWILINNKNLSITSYVGHSYTTKFFVCWLKFKFTWASYIYIPDNPNAKLRAGSRDVNKLKGNDRVEFRQWERLHHRLNHAFLVIYKRLLCRQTLGNFEHALTLELMGLHIKLMLTHLLKLGVQRLMHYPIHVD